MLGLVIGFVLGVDLAELANRRDQKGVEVDGARAEGRRLLVGVELAGALLATVVWVVGVPFFYHQLGPATG